MLQTGESFLEVLSKLPLKTLQSFMILSPIHKKPKELSVCFSPKSVNQLTDKTSLNIEYKTRAFKFLLAILVTVFTRVRKRKKTFYLT